MFDERTNGASSNRARDFGIAVERDVERARIRIFGELDLSTAPELNRVLDELNGDYAHVLLDLDGLEFMDSTGLAVIVHAELLASRNGQRLTIRCNSPAVRRLFAVTGLKDELVFDP